MNVLSEAIELIIQSPGALIYLLVTLFALQQALFPALSARRRMPNAEPPRRWLWCIGALLLGRVVLIVIGLLGAANILDPAKILPPLERWLEFASVALVIWAALWGITTKRWQTTILLVLLVASLAFYGFTAWMWPALEENHQAFNGHMYDQIWEVLTLALLTLYLLFNLLLRPPEWEWAVGLILFWALGHVAQLRWSDIARHYSGWLRLTSLVTLPLLSVLVHRQLAETKPPEKGLALDIDALQSVLQNVEFARELEPSLIVASSKLADVLDVDICAVTLTADSETPAVDVIALHPPNAAQLEAPVIPLTAYPVLADVQAEGQPQIVKLSSRTSWLADLYDQLGVETVSPLSIVPLTHEDETIGLLLLSNFGRTQTWSEEEINTQRFVATLFAASVVRARKRTQDTSLMNRLRGQDTERQQLQAILDQTQTESERLNNRITVLVQEIKNRDREILQLNRELESQSNGVSGTAVSFWQEEVQAMVKERETLHSKVRELTRDRDVLITERSYLTGELSDVKAELEIVTEARNFLQVQTATLKEKLATAEKTLSNLGDTQMHTNAGLVIVDEDGQITLADPVARKLLRLPEGDVIGMPVNGAYPDSKWTHTIDTLLSRDVSNSPQRTHLTLTIDQFTVEAAFVVLVGRDGRPDGLAITLRSPESDVEWHETIVSLANDIRTPMTSITGYTDLLLGEQAGILTEMQQQFLERVKANIELMNHQLNDLVLTASPDSRPVELSPQSVNLIEIIEEAVMGLAARFRERKLAVRLDLPPELAEVQADRDSLYQILLRLVSNAALCSKAGTEVVVSAGEDATSQSGEFIRISVADTGGGIAPEDHPRVFRRFYRANQPLIQGMGETGIGMAMAQTLVKANGGRVWVESTPDIGSTFSFILPTNGNK